MVTQAFMQKGCPARFTDKALHTPWCHFISGLWWVSLAEYILVLRVYSPLLQMTCSIMTTASIVSTLRGMKTRSWGMIIYAILSCCFCWIWLWNWLVFELSVCEGLKLLCFRYLWTRVVITMWTTCEMDVTWCNMWLVMLNHYDLGCMQVGLKSFVVSVDCRVYMDSSMTVWSLRWLLSYLCSYKLVGSVTLYILVN